ncbi:hypothetical protein Q8F55_001024 [Vanrija albida]|uniref:Uncharacterized protein n=1 Tax=Vanrija albida TaxID=181172 RepID=A0ABR3QEX4_9TREE
MVVLDPYAAASKPMPDWESIPKDPLVFAASFLQPLDVNTHRPTPSSVSSSQKLPRPRRPNDTFASSSGSTSKHSKTHSWAASTTSHHAGVGSDEWMEEKVAQCVDNAKGDLIIHNFGLQTLSTKISDLRDLSAPDIGVYASQNLLVSLPSALFDIRNLTVLSLRSNRLESLPAAIGELRNLKELNISNNLIRYLPSTILDLSLEQFSAHPNRWIEPSHDSGEIAKSPVTRRNSLPITAPTRSLTQSGPVPSLASLCLTVLLSPRPPSNLPPLIDCYNWDDCRVRGQHPLLDPHILSHSMPPSFSVDELGRILQSVKSACSSRAQTGRLSDPFPHSYRVPPPDDAAENPYYSPCPSTRHWTENDLVDSTQSRRIFLHAAEERFQWRVVANVSNLPIRWLGCSPGCLEFLDEEDDEEEWPVEL